MQWWRPRSRRPCAIWWSMAIPLPDGPKPVVSGLTTEHVELISGPDASTGFAARLRSRCAVHESEAGGAAHGHISGYHPRWSNEPRAWAIRPVADRIGFDPGCFHGLDHWDGWESGQLLFVRQTLADRARMAARWGALNSYDPAAIRRMVLFGTAEPRPDNRHSSASCPAAVEVSNPGCPGPACRVSVAIPEHGIRSVEPVRSRRLYSSRVASEP